MKITKDYLKELIKEQLEEITTQSAPINPFTELYKAKEAFKKAMELCNSRYSSEEYKRLSKIKEEILNAVVACDYLLESLEYKGKPFGQGLRPIVTSDRIVDL